MKNKIKYIILVALLLLIAILYSVPTFYKHWFITKHITIFITGVYILIWTVFSIYKNITKSYQLKTALLVSIKGFIILMVIGILYLGSNFQMNYIKTKEIPPLIACGYYDNFGNLVYTSQFKFSCPEIEDYNYEISETGGKLSFKVTEFAYGKGNTSVTVEEADFAYYPAYKESTLNTYIEIVYIHKTLIDSITITSRFETKETNELDGQIKYYYSGMKRVIDNEYESNKVSSTNTTSFYNLKFDNELDISELPNFEDLEEDVVIYESIRYPKDLNDQIESGYDRYWLDIYEITFVDGNETKELFARGEIDIFLGQALNKDIYKIDFYEEERYNNHSLEYRFNYYETEVYHDLGTYNNTWMNLNNVNRRGIYLFEENQFDEEKYLTSYSRLVDNHEMGTEIILKNYNLNDFEYFVNHYSTSRIEKHQIGKKVEYYSTLRNRNGEFSEIKNHGIYNIYQFQDFYNISLNTFSYDLKEMYDYRYMMEDITLIENVNIYQDNILVHGFINDEDIK